jgi:hypothetical protein
MILTNPETKSSAFSRPSKNFNLLILKVSFKPSGQNESFAKSEKKPFEWKESWRGGNNSVLKGVVLLVERMP